MLTYNQASATLMQCIAKLRDEGKAATEAKMELELATRQLMPGGQVNYRDIPKYPSITQLMPIVGLPNMHKILMMLIYDFCRSVNVVRNMDEAQMIEAAGYLLDECGNYRIEDYVCMFAMAKRGLLVKILDRVDLQIIGQAALAYDAIRHAAGEQIKEAAFREHEALVNSANFQDNKFADDAVKKMQTILKDTEGPKPIIKPLNTTPEQANEILKNINPDALNPLDDAK